MPVDRDDDPRYSLQQAPISDGNEDLSDPGDYSDESEGDSEPESDIDIDLPLFKEYPWNFVAQTYDTSWFPELYPNVSNIDIFDSPCWYADGGPLRVGTVFQDAYAPHESTLASPDLDMSVDVTVQRDHPLEWLVPGHVKSDSDDLQGTPSEPEERGWYIDARRLETRVLKELPENRSGDSDAVNLRNQILTRLKDYENDLHESPVSEGGKCVWDLELLESLLDLEKVSERSDRAVDSLDECLDEDNYGDVTISKLKSNFENFRAQRQAWGEGLQAVAQTSKNFKAGNDKSMAYRYVKALRKLVGNVDSNLSVHALTKILEGLPEKILCDTGVLNLGGIEAMYQKIHALLEHDDPRAHIVDLYKRASKSLEYYGDDLFVITGVKIAEDFSSHQVSPGAKPVDHRSYQEGGMIIAFQAAKIDPGVYVDDSIKLILKPVLLKGCTYITCLDLAQRAAWETLKHNGFLSNAANRPECSLVDRPSAEESKNIEAASFAETNKSQAKQSFGKRLFSGLPRSSRK
jgi:hypothetical protein